MVNRAIGLQAIPPGAGGEEEEGGGNLTGLVGQKVGRGGNGVNAS